jgi:hypothetical protein
MVSLNKDNVKEGEIVEESNTVLPELHNQGIPE